MSAASAPAPRQDPWVAAMHQALDLATCADAPRGVNPRVGCVIVDAQGAVVGTGFHRGAGTAHAEIIALEEAGARARGATAVVTLEPCRHTGRTGPCTQALLAAGVARVVVGLADPTPLAGGGSGELRRAGVEVIEGVLESECAAANRIWLHVQRTQRPFVTVKAAMSLDGRVADGSGGPTWITSAASLTWVHHLRADVDAILVGRRTVDVDNPRLTARAGDGSALPTQPLRVVMGLGDLPEHAAVRGEAGSWLQIRSHDPREVLDMLHARGVQHVLVEGGPTVIGAFLDAGLVDDVCWFVAPTVLGAGPMALPRLAAPVWATIARMELIGDDVLVTVRNLTEQLEGDGR